MLSAVAKIRKSMEVRYRPLNAPDGDETSASVPHVVNVLESWAGADGNPASKLKAFGVRCQGLGILVPVVNNVPGQPAGSAWQGILAPWAIGFECPRGRTCAKMVSILELSISFLEKSFASARSPIQVHFGESVAAVGDAIPDASVKPVVGYSRTLAAKLLLLECTELSDPELTTVKPLLESLLALHCVWEPQSNETDLKFQSVRNKFQVSESVRPDVIQLFQTFQGMLDSGSHTSLKRIIQSFNSGSCISGQRISDLETRVILQLPFQTEHFISVLNSHWQNLKISESGVPMKFFSSQCSFIGYQDDVPSGLNGLWTQILTPTKEKNEKSLEYCIKVFGKGLRDLMKSQHTNRRKINLKASASQLRVKDPILAYKRVCTFVHFTQGFKQLLGADDWKTLERMFYQGILDKELNEKVRLESPDLEAKHFHFCSTVTGKAVSVDQHAEVQERAEAEHESSTFNLWAAKLSREQALWSQYLQTLESHEALVKETKVSWLLKEHEKVEREALRSRSTRFPIKSLDDGHVLPFFSQSIAHLQEEHQNLTPVYTVFFANLTVLGSDASKCNLSAIRIISDGISATPEKSIGIILAPNVAAHGGSYVDSSIEKLVDEVDALLKQDELHLNVRRGMVGFQAEPNSKRPCFHSVWLLLSEVATEDLNPFARSSLWIQRAVQNVMPKQVGEYIVPGLQIRASSAATSFSKAQQFKQHVSGASLVTAIREQLFKGCHLPSSSACAWLDLTPYDNSVLRSILHSSGKGPFEMAVSVCWIDDSEIKKANLAMWLQESAQRTLEQFFKAKLERPFNQEHQAPGYNSADFVLTMPTGNSLAFRQSSVDEWSEKFVRMKDSFEKKMQERNDKFNVSGMTYKGESKRPLEGTSEAPTQGDPFPESAVVKDIGEAKVTVPAKCNSSIDILIDSRGSFHLQAKQDCIIASSLPLCEVFGEFLTGAEIPPRSCQGCAADASLCLQFGPFGNLQPSTELGKAFPKDTSHIGHISQLAAI